MLLPIHLAAAARDLPGDLEQEDIDELAQPGPAAGIDRTARRDDEFGGLVDGIGRGRVFQLPQGPRRHAGIGGVDQRPSPRTGCCCASR